DHAAKDATRIGQRPFDSTLRQYGDAIAVLKTNRMKPGGDVSRLREQFIRRHRDPSSVLLVVQRVRTIVLTHHPGEHVDKRGPFISGALALHDGYLNRINVLGHVLYVARTPLRKMSST